MWNPGVVHRGQVGLDGGSWLIVWGCASCQNCDWNTFTDGSADFMQVCVCVCVCVRWCADDPYKSLRRHLAWQCPYCSKLIQAWISAAGKSALSVTTKGWQQIRRKNPQSIQLFYALFLVLFFFSHVDWTFSFISTGILLEIELEKSHEQISCTYLSINISQSLN